MKVTTSLKVRPYECDSYNHVNNAVYLNYLETARMDYLEKIGFAYDEVIKAGFYLYVTHVDIYYKYSALMHEELTIETYPVKLGAVSGTMHQIIRKPDGNISAEADVSWACVNHQARPSKLPDEFMVDGLKPDPQDLK